MKLLLVCLCALFTLTFANVLDFKKTAESTIIRDNCKPSTRTLLLYKDESRGRSFLDNDTADHEDGDVARFELPNDEGTMEKQHQILARSCQSGDVKSKYCTSPARDCFGNGQFVHVSFKPAFPSTPKVVLGFTLIDTNKDQNVRVRVSPVAISPHGFYVKFAPWDVSITYQLGVHWMACP